jgi:glycosyltransferase involved in cell wall biosynthesis
MKILTTNSAGNDLFGGIHIRKTQQVKYSPDCIFHMLELNHEKKYVSQDNLNIHKINTLERIGGESILGVLDDNPLNYKVFNERLELIVNDFQNVIRVTDPDIISVPGTSLPPYCLYKAARREQMLDRTIIEYAGVIEKEIGNYTGDQRVILADMGKEFVSEIARDNVTYLFPSQSCKDEVERIHGVKLDNSHVVWNGISSDFIEGGYCRKVPENESLGYVGRVHHVKNLPFFLGLNENIKEDIGLKIITDISSAAKKATGSSLLKKMSNGEVFFYHPRSQVELAKFYSKELSAGVVSSFFETYCNGAVESLVCGTPTLLSDRSGAKEVYEEYGLKDLVFSIDNIRSFKDSLDYARGIEFIIPEDLSKQLYSDLNWEKVIGKYNKIFEEIHEASR